MVVLFRNHLNDFSKTLFPGCQTTILWPIKNGYKASEYISSKSALLKKQKNTTKYVAMVTSVAKKPTKYKTFLRREQLMWV